MPNKSQPTRQVVKTAPRVNTRQHRCSQNGVLSAPKRDSIRLTPELIAEPSARGRVEVVETYFDNSGRPINRKGLGAARIARRYDEHGHQVEETYFNTEGKPTAREDLGVARIAWSYDDSGKEVGTSLFDVDGTLLPQRRRRTLERG